MKKTLLPNGKKNTAPAKSLIRVFAAVAIAIVAGCKNTPSNPLGHVDSTEGFVAFDTPRTFHGPGTVLRKAPDGAVYLVGSIKLEKFKGEESFPEKSKKKTLALDSIIETMGIPAEYVPATLKAQLGRTVEVNIKSFDGVRELTDDSYIAELKGFFSTREVVSGNIYYIVRETIASRKIEMSSSADWLGELQLNAEINKWAKTNTTLKFGSGAALVFSKEYDSFRYILYKPERLIFSKRNGAGPNQYEIATTVAAPGEINISQNIIHD